MLFRRACAAPNSARIAISHRSQCAYFRIAFQKVRGAAGEIGFHDRYNPSGMKSAQSVVGRLTQFVQRVFKTSLEIFYEALRHSPNAQGYVAGSISELLLRRYLESIGYEVQRIREKWEGKKSHHGDFYFRRVAAGGEETAWFVVEVKGVKSNSEKWHKLYNKRNLARFLFDHSEKLRWINGRNNKEEQIEAWLRKTLPKFFEEYSDDLYEYEEVKQYSFPKRETEKSRAIKKLQGLSREEINTRIEERLRYLTSRLRVLETHFVATAGAGGRAIATPQKSEFHVVAVDIFLKYKEHKFLFANPSNLESSSDHPEHLQQNYVLGFVTVNDDGTEELHLAEEWEEDFNRVYETLSLENAAREEDMQIDTRYTEEEEYA